MKPRISICVLALALAFAPAALAAERHGLSAGAGRADITPPQTGYFLGGWTRADRVAGGQSTRLFANTLVLQRGGRKVALVAVSLFAVTAGMTQDVAREVAHLGYTPENILLAATHTHSAPGGFANNPTYNTAAPSAETVTDPASFIRVLQPEPADARLYTFLVRQIALSIRRADADLAPAVAGWGRTKLIGTTTNRSIEAHLANFGIQKPYGSGHPDEAPGGYRSTIDPNVDVLRVDKLVKRRGRTVRRPIGAWSNFANHGTVVKAETQLYSEDHHAAATRVFEQLVRRAGRVPASQTVVNVYPNSNEGDMTAGLTHSGIAGAEEVGRLEAAKMFAAWKRAGRALSQTPALDLRWTMSCFCGRRTATGTVAAVGRIGLPFLTGSEEGRGPLYDITRVPFEGARSPVDDPHQGHKWVMPIGSFPPAVPLTVLRVGDGVIGSLPGEPTKQVGVQVKQALLAEMRRVGVRRAVIAGLAGDYINYIATPQEYDWQSYEGGSTLYGPNESTFLRERLVELANGIVRGAPAPAPHVYDASYGVHPSGARYPPGAAAATIAQQPAAGYNRTGAARIAWRGGPSGRDRPVDAAFVSAQRKVGGRWRTVDTDLGLNMIWRSDQEGRYEATWQIPRNARPGTYRLVVTGTRYRLTSTAFAVTA